MPTALRILESAFDKVFEILCLTELISCVINESFQTQKKCKLVITIAKNECQDEYKYLDHNFDEADDDEDGFEDRMNSVENIELSK